MDKFVKGTILHELQPHCDALLPLMRAEKEKSGTTYQQIADSTGITLETIKRFYAGDHKQPSVYKIAALCKFFNLSMDALFGFAPSAKVVAYTELEERDAEIATLLEQLKASKDALTTRSDEYERRILKYQELLEDSKSDKAELVDAMKRGNAYTQSKLAEKEAEFKRELAETKADYKATIRGKDRSIAILSTVLGILVLAVLTVLIIDKLNPTIGWFRG